jgi:hypothetical protein
MKDAEHLIQKAFFDWIDIHKNKIKALSLFHAVPNGGHRHVAVAAKLKREGVKSGVLDTQLPVPRGGFIGLAIEFKAPGGKQTAEQEQRAEALMKEGWCVMFCWSWESASRAAIGYLGMSKIEIIDNG